MSDESTNNKRIAKNTLLLYIRMLFIMVVSLYTSRVVLNSLGVDDYGVYNVVGGVVSVFGVLTGSLSAAISRFITFNLGKGNKDKLSKVFCTSINIQLVLIAIITILLETIGLWFFYNKMVIPDNRMDAAFWVFQLSVVTFAISLLSVPYNASIIAHEKMGAFAYISILDIAIKLAIAFLIQYEPFDRLVYFAILLFIAGIINRLIYAIYCKRHFEECTYHFIWDRETLKEMFGFAGWNFIGAASATLRTEGGNIIINLFNGPTVNAARGIAVQVSGAVGGFVGNFMTALNPQITKNYAMGNYDYMMKLIFQGARLSYYILLILSLPIIVTTPYLLHLWLGQSPEHTVAFIRLVLIFSMSESLASPLITAMLATGNIRNYQLVVGGLQLMNLPVSYVFLKYGFPPETIFIVAIAISVICEMARLIMLRSMIHISIRGFLSKVYFNVIGVTLISAIIPIFTKQFFSDNFYSFIFLCIISIISASLSILYIGCNSSERERVWNWAKVMANKLKQ